MRSWGLAAVSLGLLAFLAFSQACPTVAVVTPETVIIERIPRPIPDSATDYPVTGVITDWKEIKTPAINIPILELLFRGIACWVTVDVRVLDLATAEFKAYEVTVNVTGIEIFGFRFGASPQDIARAVAKEIASRVCRER